MQVRHFSPGIFAIVLVVGCGGSDASNGGDRDSAVGSDAAGGDVSFDAKNDAPGDAPSSDATSDGGADTNDAAPSDDGPFATKRDACTFKAGDKPSVTFGPSIAGLKIPIDTIVIVSQENHSFDNYFSDLAAVGVTDADVASKTAKLPDSTGKMIARADMATECSGGYDPHHDWDSSHKDFDGGKNDGFLGANGDNAVTIDWFDSTDLPFYYALANDYGISDRYFCGVLGPTGPNRLYLYAGSSYGHVANGGGVAPGAPDIFTRLKAAGATLGIYSGGGPGGACPGPSSFERAMFCSHTPVAGTTADFEADAAAGKLPNVSYIYPGSDEHPTNDVQAGETKVQRYFDALVKSPQWYDAKTGHGALFVLTYDEGGGFYDHVAPPKACKPDDIAPIVPGEASTPGAFDHYGFRVPLVMASPFSKPHYVSHEIASHTSLLRLLELRFDMPALTARDANAGALIDFFDFTSKPPPMATPRVPPAATDKGC
jgi:phospholipase C